jgi:putative transposase
VSDRRRQKRYRFGKYDRIIIGDAHYRVVESRDGKHRLQLVNQGALDPFHLVKTDREIDDHLRAGKAAVDTDYYSAIRTKLRVQGDDSDYRSLDDCQRLTVAWKREWCGRFLLAASDLSRSWRPRRTPAGMERFIQAEKDGMDRWFLDTFGERRKPGRNVKGAVRKNFDYPSASTLRDWLTRYREGGYRAAAFFPRYANCGNRNQLDAHAKAAIVAGGEHYMSRLQPTVADVMSFMDGHLARAGARSTVSEKTVRRHLKALDPFKVCVAREGPDRAVRKFTAIGRGLDVRHLLERVEMDDWETDLMTLVSSSSAWKRLSQKERAKVPRVRCTITIAIDVRSRCVVGFNISEFAPNCGSTKAALRSVLSDKSAIALEAGAKSEWPMSGRLSQIVTDGGPAFKGEFSAAAAQICSREFPEPDPRYRGHIESFFRSFKRLCRRFAGYTFENVVRRDDYDPEKMATVTIDEFRRQVVRFICDDYHLKPHRGLGRRSPARVWTELSRDGMAPVPGWEKITQAFGFECSAKLRNSGITWLDGRYNDERLAALFRLAPGERIDFLVDPDDVSRILVEVPRRFRDQGEHFGRPAGEPVHYLAVEASYGRVKGATLSDLVNARAALRDLAGREHEQDQTRALRALCYWDLNESAIAAMREAGVALHQLTQETFDRVCQINRNKERKAFYDPDGHADDDERLQGTPLSERGTVVHTQPMPTAVDRPASSGSSVNNYRGRKK